MKRKKWKEGKATVYYQRRKVITPVRIQCPRCKSKKHRRSGIYRTPKADFQWYTCKKCNKSYTILTKHNLSKQNNKKYHTCPRCKKRCYGELCRYCYTPKKRSKPRKVYMGWEEPTKTLYTHCNVCSKPIYQEDIVDQHEKEGYCSTICKESIDYP